MATGYSNSWTLEQCSRGIQDHDQAEDDRLFGCFGWLPSFTSYFPNTSPKKRADLSECTSWECAGVSEPIFVGSPENKLDRNTHPYACTVCKEPYSQPSLLHWHVEKEHSKHSTSGATHELSGSKGRKADRNHTMSDNIPLSPTRTHQTTFSDVSERTFVHATSAENLPQSPSPTLLSSPIQKPTVLTIISLAHINAFVEVWQSPQWIQQGPQTYSWEHFRGLNGATEAIKDFLIRYSA